MKIAFPSIFCLCLITICNAQEPAVKNEIPNIEVTGSAEIEIIPDEIYVSIVLQEKNKNSDKWKIEVQEDNLMKKLVESGFDVKNLTLSNANGEYEYYIFRKDQVITSKSLQMKLANAGEVNKLFKILDELDIEDAAISKTSYSQMEQLRKDIKIKAIKAAKDKADYLLAAIGEQTGKPLLIKETESGYSNALQGKVAGIRIRGSNSIMQSQGFEDQISFTKIKIRYEVFARFSIK